MTVNDIKIDFAGELTIKAAFEQYEFPSDWGRVADVLNAAGFRFHVKLNESGRVQLSCDGPGYVAVRFCENKPDLVFNWVIRLIRDAWQMAGKDFVAQ